MGMLGAFFAVWLVVMIVMYVYFAVALMSIAKKTNTDKAWLAWIPIANVYLMTQCGGVSGWFTLLVVAAVIPVVGFIAMTAGMIYIWWKIAEAINKPGWWSILLLIPVVNLVIVGIMAWGK